MYAEIQDALVGALDFHLFNDVDPRIPAAPVSAVISTRVTPGQEGAFQEWQRKIAATEAKYEGYQGYKLEPPIPGVQDDWVMVVRFDNDAHLDSWLNSAERKQLLADSSAFDAETHIRKIQSGFETWFTSPPGAERPKPAAWKMNMIVLMVLYPVVFLFGFFVGTPLLTRAGVPFWLSLFIGNIVSVSLTGWWLIPQGSKWLTWWVFPDKDAPPSTVWTGAAIVLAVYAISLALFSRFPPALIR
jgi:antibiotic biosynthesis monooxygenase (ABM) superfamily enzyme